jgi:hypothetical protein
VFLPLVLRNASPPPAPTLDAISNADGDGSYTVSWSAATGATGHTIRATILTPALISNDHFEMGAVNPLVIGDFGSQTEASGTWEASFSDPTYGYCLGNGTWSANHAQ